MDRFNRSLGDAVARAGMQLSSRFSFRSWSSSGASTAQAAGRELTVMTRNSRLRDRP